MNTCNVCRYCLSQNQPSGPRMWRSFSAVTNKHQVKHKPGKRQTIFIFSGLLGLKIEKNIPFLPHTTCHEIYAVRVTAAQWYKKQQGNILRDTSRIHFLLQLCHARRKIITSRRTWFSGQRSCFVVGCMKVLLPLRQILSFSHHGNIYYWRGLIFNSFTQSGLYVWIEAPKNKQFESNSCPGNHALRIVLPLIRCPNIWVFKFRSSCTILTPHIMIWKCCFIEKTVLYLDPANIEVAIAQFICVSCL